MTLDGYNRFCGSLAATTHVVQWGGANVWKVAGKVFAIAWFDDEDRHAEPLVTFKCSDLSFELLKELPGCRPAPYLASRGMKWIQRTGPDTLDDRALSDYLIESHRIVASGLPKHAQKEFGVGGNATRDVPAKAAKRLVATNPKQSSRAAASRAPSKSQTSNPKSQRAGKASRGEAR